MTTMQQIVEAAYSRSTANDPGKLATDGELIAVANRIYHALFALQAAAAPERFTSRVALAALAGVPASAALSADIIDVRRVQTAAGLRVNVFPVEEVDRTTYHLAPAVYRLGGSLVSRGGVGDPVAGDILTVFQLDAPVDIVALATALDARFPVRHVELLVVELAIYLATKDSGRNAAEFEALKNYRAMNLEMLFRLSGLSMTALQSPHGGSVHQRLSELMTSGKGAQ